MTSHRVAAVAEADAVTAEADGDPARALKLAVEAGAPSATLAVLRDRREHPDPFASFPH